MNRRDFLRRAYKIGGLAALYNLGISNTEVKAWLTMGPTQSSAAVCEIVQQTEDGASGGSSSVGNASNKYFASKFSYSGTNGKAICKGSAWLEKVGSPTRDYFIKLYTNDAVPDPDEPDTLIGTSDAIDSSSVAASEEKVTVTFSVPSSALTNGTAYHVVLYTATNDADNYLKWHLTDGTTESIVYSDDGSTWTYESASKTQKFELVSE